MLHHKLSRRLINIRRGLLVVVEELSDQKLVTGVPGGGVVRAEGGAATVVVTLEQVLPGGVLGTTVLEGRLARLGVGEEVRLNVDEVVVRVGAHRNGVRVRALVKELADHSSVADLAGDRGGPLGPDVSALSVFVFAVGFHVGGRVQVRVGVSETRLPLTVHEDLVGGHCVDGRHA